VATLSNPHNVGRQEEGPLGAGQSAAQPVHQVSVSNAGRNALSAPSLSPEVGLHRLGVHRVCGTCKAALCNVGLPGGAPQLARCVRVPHFQRTSRVRNELGPRQ
jgi:hypothetical protein